MHLFVPARRRLLPMLVALTLVSPVMANDDANTSSAVTSELMPLVAKQGLTLDITDGASRAIAVGERGHILISETRAEWRQVADVPTRSTLTAVSAVGDAVWAVGHDGVILSSRDGGLTWSKQREDIFNPNSQGEWDPRQGVPLLDVLMVDANTGFAIGAYAQLLKTTDAGVTWNFISTVGNAVEDEIETFEEAEEDISDEDEWSFSEEDLALDEEAEPHFNAITRTPNGVLIIVGERGAAYRSVDNGDSWERMQLPYGGSMFGVISLGDDHVVAFGMRGNAFESRDAGNTWEAVDTQTDLTLMGGVATKDGGFVLVGANGIVIKRTNAQAEITSQIYTNANNETPVLAGVMQRGNGSLLVSGEKGVDEFTLRKKTTAE